MMQKMLERFKRVKTAQAAAFLLALGVLGSIVLTTDFLPGASRETVAVDDSLEARLTRALSAMEGAGAVEVVIFYQEALTETSEWLQTSTRGERVPVSAIVVAEGAGDLSVRLEIAQAVRTLLRLDAESVEVFRMGE